MVSAWAWGMRYDAIDAPCAGYFSAPTRWLSSIEENRNYINNSATSAQLETLFHPTWGASALLKERHRGWLCEGSSVSPIV